jgi:hypothetical protein
MEYVVTMENLQQAIGNGHLRFKPWLSSFTPEIFEVDFSDVISGKGPAMYLDPKQFFENTFMTTRMKDVLQWSLARTAGLNNKGIIYLATGFGGGKSHLLTMLYHVFKSKTVPDQQILSEISMDYIPSVQIVAVDGHNLSYPMSKSKDLKSYMAETKDGILSALAAEGKPVLMLIDEFVVYLAKLTEEQQRQETACLHTLIEAMKSTKDSVLVVTSPRGSAVYGKESQQLDAVFEISRKEEAADGISAILGRVTQPIVPVEKGDFVSILKTRLVDHIDLGVAEEIERNLGKRLNLDFTEHYPFHPLLVDVLYNRVSLYPGFQKTRDALKVIALAIKGLLLHKSNASFYVISPSDLLLDDPDAKAILTNERVFGSNLEQAVTQDAVKSAREADNGKIYGRFSRIASAVYLYSLHPEPIKRGAVTRDVFQSLTDAVSEADVEQMLDKFYGEHSSFLWHEGGKYLFKSRQNVPNMIKLRANQVDPSEICKYIEDDIYSIVFAESANGCTFYRCNDYAPAPNMVNAVACMYWDDVETVSSSVLSINADKKNTVVVLVPTKEQKGALEWYSKLVLGAERVLKEVKGEKGLQEEAKKLRDMNEANAVQQFKSMYSKVRYLHGTAIRETAIDPTKGTTFDEALMKRLREAQKIVDATNVIPINYLLPLLGSRKAVQVRTLFGDVETMTIIPFATRSDIKTIIQKGVYESAVGIVEGILPEEDQLTGRERIHFNETISVNDGDTVVASKYAQELIDLIKAKKGAGGAGGGSGGGGTGGGGTWPPVGGSGGSGGVPPPEKEEVQILVSDASDIYQQLSDKMTELLMNGDEARAEVSFSGLIMGSITAKNMEEIRSIVDLALGISKASSLLGAVKVTTKIYKKIKPS